MVFDPRLVDLLEELPAERWNGIVHRYTPRERDPERENIRGARWNPPEVPAIYASLQEETLLAEFRHAIDSWSPRPNPGNFMIHRIRVSLTGIVDLQSPGVLDRLGVDPVALISDDQRHCREVGGAVHWLGRGGIIVPSARSTPGSNLVIFTDRQPPEYTFEVLDSRPAQ